MCALLLVLQARNYIQIFKNMKQYFLLEILHVHFSNPFIFAIQLRRLRYVKIWILLDQNQRFTSSGCKDIGIIKCETQFLCNARSYKYMQNKNYTNELKIFGCKLDIFIIDDWPTKNCNHNLMKRKMAQPWQETLQMFKI